MKRLVRFLGSPRLAVVVLLALSAVLALATCHESLHDARSARHLVYGSGWFAALLALLGVNVLCSALVRFPWRRRHAGFLVTHLGIIVILVGSLLSFVGGFEGTMTLEQGESSDVVVLEEPVLEYQVQENATGEPPPVVQQQVPAEFRWNPPREGHELRVPLGSGMTVVLDRYLDSASEVNRYVPGAGGGSLAVHFVLSRGSLESDAWLCLDTASHARATVGPATIRLWRAESEAALQAALKRPSTCGKWPMAAGLLLFDLAAGVQVVPVEGNVGRVVALQGTPYHVRIERYLPCAVVRSGKLVNRASERENPCVELAILDERGVVLESRLMFAQFPEFSGRRSHGKQLELGVQYTFDDPATEEAAIDLIAGPADRLYYCVRAKEGIRHGEVELNREIATGWAMGLTLAVKEVVPGAVRLQEYEPVRVPRGREGPPPAIRFRVEGADRPGPYWLQLGDQVDLARDRQQVRLGYRLRTRHLGFSVKLLRFTVGHDPGARDPASFTSEVQVDDPSGPLSFPAAISLNEPLHHRGLSFFQYSCSRVPGHAPTSTLQVTRDPGMPLKYVGSLLLVAGLVIQFFLQPARRKEDEAGRGSQEEEHGT